MGLFDRFKKQPRVSLEQLSYDIAYKLFPAYAFEQPKALLDAIESSPDSTHALLYFIICKAHEIEPDHADAERYRWHKISGEPSGIRLILEYPKPAPIDLSDQSFEDIKNSMGKWVLAPHFSALIVDEPDAKPAYYVLGQSSMGGGTTLRRVDADGANLNLGPGPQPELAAFLAAVDSHLAQTANKEP